MTMLHHIVIEGVWLASYGGQRAFFMGAPVSTPEMRMGAQGVCPLSALPCHVSGSYIATLNLPGAWWCLLASMAEQQFKSRREWKERTHAPLSDPE